MGHKLHIRRIKSPPAISLLSLGPIFMMAPSDRQRKMLLGLVVRCIVPTVWAVLQINFILMVVILLQHQKVKQEADID